MEFEFKGFKYKTEQTGKEIYNRSCYIELPDGKYLHVFKWLERNNTFVALDFLEITLEDMSEDPQIVLAERT